MDSHNIAFNSSMALDGEGYGIVIRTGDNTFIGRWLLLLLFKNPIKLSGSLAKLTNQQKRGASNLSMEITRFVRFIALLSLVTGGIVFGAALAVDPHQNILALIVFGFITIITANVPQGLPGQHLISNP